MKLNIEGTTVRLFKRGETYYCEFARHRKKSLKTNNLRDAKLNARAEFAKYCREAVKLIEGDGTITLAQFKKVFFVKHTDIAPKTIDSYETVFNLMTEEFGGDARLATVPGRLEDFKLSNLWWRAIVLLRVEIEIGVFSTITLWGFLNTVASAT